MNLQWSMDLGRSIDYAETRDDLEAGKLAYMGFSLGAGMGPRLVAVEPRFKAAIFVNGGSFERVAPEVDAWNFAPRVRVPVLMLNGRDDYLYPLETSQRPLFEALGTADRNKKHTVYDGAHNIYSRVDVATDILAWLDRYLGPVRR